jgi:hypothetical protein
MIPEAKEHFAVGSQLVICGRTCYYLHSARDMWLFWGAFPSQIVGVFYNSVNKLFWRNHALIADIPISTRWEGGARLVRQRFAITGTGEKSSVFSRQIKTLRELCLNAGCRKFDGKN